MSERFSMDEWESVGASDSAPGQEFVGAALGLNDQASAPSSGGGGSSLLPLLGAG